MSKLTSEQKEFSILGIFIGLLVAFRLYVKVGPELAAVGFIGSILGGYAIGYWLSDASERAKFMTIYGILGIMVGLFVGSVQLNMHDASILEAALIGSVVYGLGLGSIALFFKARDRYLSFKGEAFWIPFLGSLGALGASYIPDLLEKGEYTKNFFAQGTLQNTTANIIFIFVGSLLLSITLGMFFSGNRRRPVIGALFTMLAGIMVLKVGIAIAPILFMPGSGLYWAGLVVGLILVGLSLMVLAFPESHTYMGLGIIVFSILSYVGAAGGLLVGGLFGLLGGTLVFAWTGLEAAPPEEGQN